MTNPKLTLVETLTSARTYHFQSTTPLGGWALCTVNDGTGELLITSDWGNWAHLWNPKHLGSPSLTHFIADRRSYDYLANKLLGQQEAWVLDAEATIRTWRRTLAVERLHEGRQSYQYGVLSTLTREHAREIWDDLGSLYADELHEHVFLEHAMRIDGIDWISECPWEDTVHCYSQAYRLLVDFLLPALAAACAVTLQHSGQNAAR